MEKQIKRTEKISPIFIAIAKGEWEKADYLLSKYRNSLADDYLSGFGWFIESAHEGVKEKNIEKAMERLVWFLSIHGHCEGDTINLK